MAIEDKQRAERIAVTPHVVYVEIGQKIKTTTTLDGKCKCGADIEIDGELQPHVLDRVLGKRLSYKGKCSACGLVIELKQKLTVAANTGTNRHDRRALAKVNGGKG